MTPEEITKRNGKSLNLRVIQLEDSSFYVESEEGKICYKVCCGDGNENACSCGDFSRGVKTDPQYTCKHLLAVLNSEVDFEQAHILEKAKPKLDERFIMTIEGQDFVKYAGLLDLAHQKKLTSLQTEIVQYPNQENERTAIVKAHARTATGSLFTDIGDANPMNCTSRIAKHLIRLASTRAKARCLRDLTNIGMTCLEELGDLDDVIGGEKEGTARRDKVKPFPRKIVKGEATVSPPGGGNGNGTRPAGPAKGVSTPGATVNQEVKEHVKEPSRDEKKATVENQPTTKGAKKSGGNGQKAGDDTKSKKVDIPAKMSEAQRRAVHNLSRRRGISIEELEKMAQSAYGVSLENLSTSDASSFIRQLQQSA